MYGSLTHQFMSKIMLDVICCDALDCLNERVKGVILWNNLVLAYSFAQG